MKLIISFVFLLACTLQSSFGGAYKSQLDQLEKKFASSLKKADAQERQLAMFVLSTEVLGICAQLHEIKETRDILQQRLKQYREALAKAASPEEKMLLSTLGIYNNLIMIANARCKGTPFIKPILDLDKKSNAITRSDSLSRTMKTALMMTQSFKVSSIFTVTADKMGQNKEALEKLVKEFDAEAARAKTPGDGIAVAAEYLARMMNHFAKLSFPRLQSDFHAFRQELDAPALSSDMRAFNAMRCLFQTTALLSRRLDLK